MTQDEIIEMARQAGEFKDDAFPEPWIPFFVKFAKLVAAKEREACALICDKEQEVWGWDSDVIDAAQEIRARGEA